MPIFGETSSPFDESVEKVTDEKNTGENWSLMLDISDRVASDITRAPKQCLLSIRKRLNNRDPHVIILALSLLDCVWCNSGTAFRRAVSSKDFCSELRAKATHSNRIVGEKTRLLIKKWASEECKNDPSLSLLVSLYQELLGEGLSFDSSEPKKTKAFSKDPNVVMSNKEEEDLAIALANSMKDLELKKTSTSYYPTSSISKSVMQKSATRREVRALYDFEAAEENEITFGTGDILTVTDDSDPNWWRGTGPRGNSGLFPSSFVSADLNDPLSSVTIQQEEPVTEAPRPVTIDPDVIDRCLEYLQLCDPIGERPDPPELAELEENSIAQAKLIDRKLADIDKQHNMLAGIDNKIRNVLALYDNAVQQLNFNYQVQAPQGVPYGSGASSSALPGQQMPVQYPYYGQPQQMMQQQMLPPMHQQYGQPQQMMQQQMLPPMQQQMLPPVHQQYGQPQERAQQQMLPPMHQQYGQGM